MYGVRNRTVVHYKGGEGAERDREEAVGERRRRDGGSGVSHIQRCASLAGKSGGKEKKQGRVDHFLLLVLSFMKSGPQNWLNPIPEMCDLYLSSSPAQLYVYFVFCSFDSVLHRPHFGPDA
jgi:hypothetical protein